MLVRFFLFSFIFLISLFTFFAAFFHKPLSYQSILPDGVARIFLPTYAVAGIQTHVSRVAPTLRVLLKDAQPTELPHRAYFLQTKKIDAAWNVENFQVLDLENCHKGSGISSDCLLQSNPGHQKIQSYFQLNFSS